MLDRYLNPQNDIAFKRIFGQEKNKDLLLALINTVAEKQLHKPIQEAHLIPRVQDPETVFKKTSILDLMCQDEDGCMYIIEMQVASSEGFKERAQYYAAKAYINQANQGGLYSSLKKVIFLAFTNYPIFPEKASYKSDHQILDIVTHEQNFEKLVFTIVDLATFDAYNKKPLHKLNLQEKFCYFLRHAQALNPEQVALFIKDTPVMSKAFEALNRAYWSDEELQMYENQEKKDWDYRSAEYQRGIDEGKEKGIQLGEKIGKQEGIKEGIQLGKKEGIQLGKKEGIQLGKQEGRQEGRQEGIQLGKQEGRQEGIQLGKKEGIQLGKQEGRQNTLSALVKKGIISQQQADEMLKGRS